MWCFYRSSLPILLICLLNQYANSCENFLAQYCTDIPIGFNSISSIKCIQLVPNQFNLSIDYSVQNYIIIKAAQCYNILLFNSSSTILFSNECREQCPEQYCLLFDNQPNTSIINIFYSQSSTYELINSITPNNISSYDYLLFDTCSSSNQANQILLIIVYVLAGIIVILTIVVILKFIISWRLRRKSSVYEPYNWRWIIDSLCCRVRQDDLPASKQEKNSSDSDITEGNHHLRINENHLSSRNNFGTSTQPYMISTGSSNNTHERRTYEGSSSGNSFDQRYRDISSEYNTPALHPHTITEYIGVVKEQENEDSSVEIDDHNHRPSSLHLLQKLSSKASATLSAASEYTKLETKPSSEIINIRL
jgi:hypothetical protein